MLRSEVRAWLEANDGQKNVQEKQVPVTVTIHDEKKTVYEKHVIWTANNGKVLEIVDESNDTTGAVDGMRPGDRDDGQGGRDPDYRLVSEGDPDNTDTRSPEVKTEQESKAAEAAWQRDNGPASLQEGATHGPLYDGSGRGSGIYETHSARIDRERQAKQDADRETDRQRTQDERDRAARIDEARIQTDKDRLDIERGRAETDRARANSEGANQAELTQQGRDRIEIDRERLEAEKAGGWQTVGSPSDTDQFITQVNNRTAETRSVQNPNYDPIKKASTEERERLRDAVAVGKFSAEVAAQQYKEWYDKNVTAPLALAAEKRAQAEEARQAREAVNREKQFKAQNDLARGKLGQEAAESAQANERALLPYRVGPKFAGQFSSALNGLSGKMDQNAEAGINFTPDAFEFDAPNWKKIAKNATSEALKHLTPYKPDMSAPSVADYSGITMPNSDTMAGAPAGYSPSAGLSASMRRAEDTVSAYNPGIVPINSQ